MSIVRPARMSIAPAEPTALLTSTALPGSIVNFPSGGVFGKSPTVIVTVPPLPVPLRLPLEMHAPCTAEQLSAPAGAAVPVPRMTKSPFGTAIVMAPPVVLAPVLSAEISLPDCISMSPSVTVIEIAFPLVLVPLHLMLPVLVISRFSPAGSVSAYGHGVVTGVEIVHNPAVCAPPPAVHAADANASSPITPRTTAMATTATMRAPCRCIPPLKLSMSSCLLSMCVALMDAANIVVQLGTPKGLHG